MLDNISIIIPAHNEESSIAQLLSDLRLTEIDSEYMVRIIVVCNACSDQTYNVANGLKALDTKLEVYDLEQGGKTRALNYALSLISDGYVVNIDADCRIEPKLVQKLVSELEPGKCKLVGSLDVPNLNRFNKNTYLYQILRTQQIYREEKGRSMPVGRCLAYRRDLINEYPLNIHSEDNWISLFTAQNFGWDRVKVVVSDHVTFNPPTNWIDYIKQETRYDNGYLQVMQKFPELESTYEARPRNVDKSAVRSRTLLRLDEEGIPACRLDDFMEVISKIFIDNSEILYPSLVTHDGSWEQIQSTKS